jgi:nucleoid-associated protein YgaU
MLRCLLLFAILIFSYSCTKPPYMEMDEAEYMVNRAQEKQALEFAPSEYNAAQTALIDARKAMGQADYTAARESLEFALKHAHRAVELAEEGQIRQAAEEAAERRRVEEKPRQTVQKTAPQETTPKTPEPPTPPKAASKPQPKVVPASSYTVKEGETLWIISAQPQVYGDGLLWPLLYQANRDQIKDPRQIFPGQTLSIHRDMTEKDLEDARQRARESDIFPIPDSVPAKQ